ncbi:unnamed protein product [Bursaphelenchus okinawaensis]|uniref:Malonyl-CoA:ACP transacylase (MAT) domain-containing protein n=1 Tax=Bursaphelenchus okinawaensis TaxID=465554 RepID=A0A811K9M1_9BILA|nr:unnamed protein product [Bursaphelenchus okinawaensis]CAG9094838.1 unnamed protein product [Bursaphelenchus okinawaensis]
MLKYGPPVYRYTSRRFVRKGKFTAPAEWLKDATTFKDTHTVLTDPHSPLPYPTEQLRSYLHKTEAAEKLKKKQATIRPKRQALEFSHIPIEEQCVALFPGQGAQFVGMGKSLLEIKECKAVFDQANEILGYDIAKVCVDGPKTKLDQTIYCQPAIFVSSMAALQKLNLDAPELSERFTECAGFSVGEFTALVLAGVLKFEDAMKIIDVRARAMHECNQRLASGMITVKVNAASQLDKAISEAKQLSLENGEMPICEVSNFLYCGVKVVGASNECITYLKQNSERLKYKVIKDLEVSGAFHTVLMAPAEQELRNVLKQVEIGQARMNVYSNYTGKLYPHKPSKIREHIIKQVSSTVRWEQIMQLLYRKHQDYKFPEFFEIGPGKQLGAILYNVSKKAYKHYNHVSC